MLGLNRFFWWLMWLMAPLELDFLFSRSVPPVISGFVLASRMYHQQERPNERTNGRSSSYFEMWFLLLLKHFILKFNFTRTDKNLPSIWLQWHKRPNLPLRTCSTIITHDRTDILTMKNRRQERRAIIIIITFDRATVICTAITYKVDEQ